MPFRVASMQGGTVPPPSHVFFFSRPVTSGRRTVASRFFFSLESPRSPFGDGGFSVPSRPTCHYVLRPATVPIPQHWDYCVPLRLKVCSCSAPRPSPFRDVGLRTVVVYSVTPLSFLMAKRACISAIYKCSAFFLELLLTARPPVILTNTLPDVASCVCARSLLALTFGMAASSANTGTDNCFCCYLLVLGS